MPRITLPVQLAFRTITGNSPLSGNSFTVYDVVNPATVTLPAASSSLEYVLYVKNSSSGNVTIASSGGNIDSSSTLILPAGQGVQVISNGTIWRTLSMGISGT
jgi:hypothetical protein